MIGPCTQGGHYYVSLLSKATFVNHGCKGVPGMDVNVGSVFEEKQADPSWNPVIARHALEVCTTIKALKPIRKGEALFESYLTYELGEELDKEARGWCGAAESAMMSSADHVPPPATAPPIVKQNVAVSNEGSSSSGGSSIRSSAGSTDNGSAGGGGATVDQEHDLGTHLIADFGGCAAVELLEDADKLERVIMEALLQGNLTIMSPVHIHRFQPKGLSALAVLAESHLSIHTWPEWGKATLDVYACGTTAEPAKALAHLAAVLQPSDQHVIKLPRGRHATCAQVSPFPATNSELADNVLTTCDGEGPVAENRPSAERVEVLIIGAGMAGMTAAHILATANVSFAVLEAQNYTGGRIHAMQFGHSDGTLCVSRLRPID